MRGWRHAGFLCAVLWLDAAASAAGLLPRDVRYDRSVPRPEHYLGYRIGERHIRHHELVGYMRAVAEASPRARLVEYARSYGGRPLVLLILTSAENQRRLEAIRRAHLRLRDPAQSQQVDVASLPIVVNLCYSVHGNEASGGNAAPLAAYYLAAAQGDPVDSLLDQAVVLLDPCLNPDGFDRFAAWANRFRGAHPNPDRNHREHNEPWPGGRTNYYWFDLNRDWMPVQHPESRGRIAIQRSWAPNLVLDFHEMGTDSTFFFQPGVPERKHPLIPEANVELTQRIATFHAAALDKIGSLYFTEERFDDFYMGKGSTYPDLHGAVGILFEQASARGHVQQSAHGPLTLTFAVRNQFTATLSSLEAAKRLRVDLLDYMRRFYRESLEQADQDEVQGYVFAAPGDPARLHHFLDILERHGIQTYRLANDVEAGGSRFAAGEAYVAPARQPEYRYLRCLCERRTQFPDSVFYDIAAWTLPLAFDLQWAELREPLDQELLGEPTGKPAFPRGVLADDRRALAYVVDWRAAYAPRTAQRLLAAGVLVKAATVPLTLAGQNGPIQVRRGDLLVPLQVQPEKRSLIRRLLRKAVREDAAVVRAATSGLTPSGPDLGSNSFALLERPRVLLPIGSGVRSGTAGEVWHLLDRRVGMPVTLVDVHSMGGIRLEPYTAIILAGGSYDALSSSAVERINQWVSGGGTLIAIGDAARWVQQAEIADVKYRRSPPDAAGRRPYAEAGRDAARRTIPGSIVEVQLDRTHPLAYGYADDRVALLRRGTTAFAPAPSRYSTPAVYADNPLLAGYAPEDALRRLSGSAAAAVYGRGRGRVIVLADDPVFRAFWFGGQRLLLNSIFFGPFVRTP